MVIKTDLPAVVGSSGLVGSFLINNLSVLYPKVISYSRRKIHFDKKNVKKLIIDFNNLENESSFKEIDHLYIALGTTRRKAGSDKNFELIKSWKNLFEPYLIQSFERGGSGADISPLNNEKNVLAGLRPDSQRYFDYHHTSIDTFDAINKRELELGTFSMASLVYLFDKYGIIK